MDIDVAGKLFPNITTILVQLAATAVMLFFFKKFLWIPIQEYFAKRAENIESNINEAKQRNEKAKQFVEESEEQSRKAAIEYRDIIGQARQDANGVKDKILQQAQADAKEKIEQASKEIEAEKEAAKADMKEEIVTIAMEVASKVVHKELSAKENQELIEEFIEEVDK
ncbi:MAG: F0F1 ATP synthase subunit B [Coprobacillaceae bacterium]